MRFGVADQPKRPNLLRPFPTRAGNRLAIVRQAAWRLTASNLPSQIKTQLKALWRSTAREMTMPAFHHCKLPRKAKSFRPF